MVELLHALGIQWYVLLAQVVNFAILIFVLSRYAYRPILRIIDQRRQVIADSIAKAKEIDQSKEALDAERVRVLRKADEEAGALLGRAKEEAEHMRTDIEKAAKAQADLIVQKGMKQLEHERISIVREIQEKLATAVVSAAEKILRRSFSDDDQKRLEAELTQTIPSLLA